VGAAARPAERRGVSRREPAAGGLGAAQPRFVVWADSITPDSTAAPDSGAQKADPWAKMMATARPPEGAVTRPLDAARFDGRHVVEMSHKSNDRGYLPNRRGPRSWRPLQLWMQSLDGSPRRRLTSTPYSHFGAAVSPDGRWIAFAADTALRADSVVTAERDSIATLPYDRARDERAPNDVDVYVVAVACLTQGGARRGRARRVAPGPAARRGASRAPRATRATSPGRPTAGASASSRARRAPSRRASTA
jgi:hypothetical protein